MLSSTERLSGTRRKPAHCSKALGPFTSRKQILKVPKLGPKAFEQCAGIQRVPESRNELDHTGVHPESYGAAEALLTLCGYGLSDVKAGGLDGLRERVAAYGEEKAAEACGVGTLSTPFRVVKAPFSSRYLTMFLAVVLFSPAT